MNAKEREIHNALGTHDWRGVHSNFDIAGDYAVNKILPTDEGSFIRICTICHRMETWNMEDNWKYRTPKVDFIRKSAIQEMRIYERQTKRST